MRRLISFYLLRSSCVGHVRWIIIMTCFWSWGISWLLNNFSSHNFKSYIQRDNMCIICVCYNMWGLCKIFTKKLNVSISDVLLFQLFFTFKQTHSNYFKRNRFACISKLKYKFHNLCLKRFSGWVPIFGKLAIMFA